MPDQAMASLGTETSVLNVLLNFLGRLNASDVAYCYWKSSRRVGLALAGETDLDLLVSRRDQHSLYAILLESGFKQFPAVTGWDHPAMASFLGFDVASGRLVHIHVHTRLVSGSALLRRYHLPWEDALLEDRCPHPTLPIQVLSAEAEFLLAVVRRCLELPDLDPIVLRNRSALREKYRLDRSVVVPYVNRTELVRLTIGLLGSELAKSVVEMAQKGRPEPDQRFRRRLRRHLTPWRSCNDLEATLRSVGRALLWGVSRVNQHVLQAPRPARRLAGGGGIVVAIIGVDGSGKSTLVRTLRSWLETEASVMPLYFGTGDGRPSLILMPLKLAARAVQPLVRQKPIGSSHGRVSNRTPGFLYSVLLTFWAGVLAIEKRRKLQAAVRAASRGMIVIADRYPQDQIPRYNDSPLLPRVGLAPAWLRRFEAEAYALAGRITPDLVLKLDAPPELIRIREPDMDPSLIDVRTQALRQLTFRGSKVVTIDATSRLTDVVQRAKCEVWALL